MIRYHFEPNNSVEHPYTSCVNILIENGANLGLKNEEEATAMHLAAKRGQKKIITALNKKDSKLLADQDANNDTAMHIAAEHGQTKCVSELIFLGAKIGKTNSKGWTPLHCAANANARDICKLLVEKGAKLDLGDKTEMTPFHLACRNGHLDLGMPNNILRFIFNIDYMYISFI